MLRLISLRAGSSRFTAPPCNFTRPGVSLECYEFTAPPIFQMNWHPPGGHTRCRTRFSRRITPPITLTSVRLAFTLAFLRWFFLELFHGFRAYRRLIRPLLSHGSNTAPKPIPSRVANRHEFPCVNLAFKLAFSRTTQIVHAPPSPLFVCSKDFATGAI